jgi:LPXTG-motif cell wall-anchored protein
MAKGKKSNIGMILIPVVLAAAGLYFIFRKKKNDGTQPATAGGATSTLEGGAVGLPDKIIVDGKTQSIEFPLRKGSKGLTVQNLQTALMQYYPALPKGYDDGKFGKNTEADLYKLTKKKMVETQAELDAIIRGGSAAAKTRKDKIVGVYSPQPVDPFITTKYIQ